MVIEIGSWNRIGLIKKQSDGGIKGMAFDYKKEYKEFYMMKACVFSACISALMMMSLLRLH